MLRRDFCLMKRKKIIVAGALVKECVYSCPAPREDAKVRAEKRKISTAAQQRINARYSWEKLELMLAANFVPGDLVVTLTFDEDHRPDTRAQAAARLKQFRQQLARMRKKNGSELVMIWNLENRSGAGRWHSHSVINATAGSDFADILRCWPFGSDVEIRRLELSGEKNYESLARYMCKEARERPGLRSWSYTRNAKHPESESFPVPDDTEVAAPEDATLLETAIETTKNGGFVYIKYLARAPQQLRKLRPKRRKRHGKTGEPAAGKTKSLLPAADA